MNSIYRVLKGRMDERHRENTIEKRAIKLKHVLTYKIDVPGFKPQKIPVTLKSFGRRMLIQPPTLCLSKVSMCILYIQFLHLQSTL